MTLPPVVKWSGSKRAVARRLHSLWPPPRPGARYFEPFVGGGTLLPARPAAAAVAGDTVAELIALWVAIRDEPGRVAAHYEHLWHRRQREGHAVYYEVRERFNRERGALDLLYLSRTCVNGLIRFNASGAFNNSLHHTRPGIHPARLGAIVLAWSRALAGVDFVAADYRATLAGVRAGDFVFLDPPYAGTRGRYHPGPFDRAALHAELARLNSVGAAWILTFDGAAGDRRYDAPLPPSLYRERLEVATGNSPFTRLMSSARDAVTEVVYLNFRRDG
ncbi:MAG: DNA adenine methylase [Candidatus Sericytochromatia bacterium]|nr:DNA adenine methylase [Candidatus Tanganyikabacteria bacterium]